MFIGRLTPPWVHEVAETFQRRFGSYDLPEDIEGLVVSPGGVASTLLIDQLNAYLRVNAADDGDRLKHRPKPPRRGARAVPALVITGHPDEIWKSLVNRDFAHAQQIRLGCVESLMLPGDIHRRQIARAVTRQQQAWERGWPNTLVVDYEDVWDRLPEIAAHFGITDPRFIDEFPARHGRTSLSVA